MAAPSTPPHCLCVRPPTRRQHADLLALLDGLGVPALDVAGREVCGVNGAAGEAGLHESCCTGWRSCPPPALDGRLDWEAMVAGAPAGVVVLSDAGDIQQINAAFATALGHRAEDLRGTPFRDLVPPAAHARLDQAMERLRIEPVRRTGRWTLLHRDGRPVPFQGAAAGLRGGDAGPGGFVGVCIDLTPEARAGEGVRSSEARFRVAFDNATVGMAMLDAQRRFTLANAALAALFGLPAERIVGRAYADLVDVPADAPEDELGGAPGERRRAERTFGQGRGGVAEVGVTALGDPVDGVAGYALVFEELTARREAERALRDSEARYRLLLQSSPNIVWLTDHAGNVVWISEQWTRATGRSFDEGLGARWLEAVHPDDLAGVEAAWTRAWGDKAAYAMEHRMRHEDGTWRWVLCRGVPVLAADGALDHYFGTVTDIDEVKAAEEAVRSSQHLQAVGQLAGGVAHEVNNMMAVVMGYASLLGPSFRAGDGRAAHVREILDAAGRTATFTRQLLAFGRRQVLQPVTLDLNQVVRGIAPMIQRLMTSRIELRLELARGPQWVHVDRAQMEQVLVNLALNARDAMPDGGTLIVQTREETHRARRVLGFPRDTVEPGTYVVLDVRDTGTGMEPAVLARAVEPFFTTKPLGQGTGLGLSTVHGILRQSGGWLALHSEGGQGTRVEALLPRAAPPAAQARATDEGGPCGAVGTETILVVDDEAAVRRVLAKAVEDAGFHALAASNGREALEVLRGERRVDLLIADLVMPGMGGRELGRLARDVRPTLKVLHVSGHPGEEVVRLGLLEEGAPLLEKPFAAGQLTEAVRRLLDEA